MDSIVLQCKRPDLGTDYVRVTVHQTGVSFSFISFYKGARFVSVYREYVYRHGNPEVYKLHDDHGWNLDELACWIRQIEQAETAEVSA